MADKARQYKPSHVRRLDTLSGNECAHPNCTKALVGEDGISIISKICHIEAASKEGARYNARMNDDERRHYNNLILLCDEHHTIIDNKENEGKFPTLLLQEWKKNHENKQLYKLRKTSLLRLAIEAIADLELENVDEPDKIDSFNIEEKINYNEIKRNRYLINDYKVFYTKVNSVYRELESQGSFKRDKLLRNIYRLYLKTKGKYTEKSVTPIDDIRKNSDNIIEDIENELLELVKLDGDFYHEDIIYGVSIIMVDAFMRCKILEEPSKL